MSVSWISYRRVTGLVAFVKIGFPSSSKPLMICLLASSGINLPKSLLIPTLPFSTSCITLTAVTSLDMEATQQTESVVKGGEFSSKLRSPRAFEYIVSPNHRALECILPKGFNYTIFSCHDECSYSYGIDCIFVTADIFLEKIINYGRIYGHSV